jgi:predicted small lipoprotein YifL
MRPILSLAIVAALGLAIAGCGRKIGLDTPYQAAVDARKEAEREGKQPLPPEPTPPVEDRPFFLDGLIR